MKKIKFLLVVFFIMFTVVKIYGNEIDLELEIEQLEEVLENNFSSPNVGVQSIYKEKNNLIKNGEKYYYFSLIYGLLMGEKPEKEVPTEVFINGVTQDIYEVKQISSREILIGRILIKSNIKIITDISMWNHSTKKIFLKNNIQINKVKIKEKYPIFYITILKENKLKKEQFEKIAKDIFQANGYWDFKLVDEVNGFCAEISGNKKDKKIEQIKYVGERKYFK